MLLETCLLEPALRQFGQTHDLLITKRVREEYGAGPGPNLRTTLLSTIFKLVDVEIDQRLLPYFHFDSTSGEIGVISYALRQTGSFCVIDEEFARQVCHLFDLHFTGSVGIIKQMHREHLLNRNDMHLIRERLRRSNFYLTDRLLNELK